MTAVRTAALVLGLGLAATLGALQIAAGIALRDSATPGAWMRALPAQGAVRFDGVLARLRLPALLRLVAARQVVDATNDLASAERLVMQLPPSPDRFELAGQLAERRGDETAGAADFLQAGDIEAVERRIGALEGAGDVARALALQQAAIDRIGADPAQIGALPESFYRLGRLLQASAYRLPLGKRGPLQDRAAQAYRQAMALAPLAERYAIAAGNQELNRGDLERAQADFSRARDVDPTSADAVAGLGEVSLRRGAVNDARDALARARTMSPAASSVLRLERALGL